MSLPQYTPSISILLPFHKEGSWLTESVQSILEQTCTDWELILIANGADRTTFEIARFLASSNERIRLVAEDRPGISHALNTGLEYAKAPLIARMDADDYSLPDRLNKQLAYMNTHPEVDVLGTCTTVHPEGPPGEGFAAFMKWQNGILTPEQHRLNRFIESPLAHPTVLFRKKTAEKHGRYLTSGIPEDYELWLRWMEKGAVFAKHPDALVMWRDHTGRLTRSHSDYSKEAFNSIRSIYLSMELKRILGDRRLIVCGADRICKQKARKLIHAGVPVAGYADVVQRHIPGFLFLPASEIKADPDTFFLSFVSSRGKAEEMHDFLHRLGMTEGMDFLLSG